MSKKDTWAICNDDGDYWVSELEDWDGSVRIADLFFYIPAGESPDRKHLPPGGHWVKIIPVRQVD